VIWGNWVGTGRTFWGGEVGGYCGMAVFEVVVESLVILSWKLSSELTDRDTSANFIVYFDDRYSK
jgi:hypothetical protein